MRAIGYCDDPSCISFTKGQFLLKPPMTYFCGFCGGKGFVVEDRVIDCPVAGDVYKTVNVEFNYNPIIQQFRSIAIVEIPELTFGGTYTLLSATMHTEKRALAIAETILGALNCGQRNDLTNVITLNLADNDRQWMNGLQVIKDRLSERERRLNYGLLQRQG